MTTLSNLRAMLEAVARALGPDLCEQVTFVGGCTTGLLLNDEFTKEGVRHTDDVDLIVHTKGLSGFHELQQTLKDKGFTIPGLSDTTPICAMMLGDLRVDFMPDDESVLGFSNRWYPAATETATRYELAPDLSIKLINPVYFLATKLEAYNGRGNGDALGSRDIEDILTLVDGSDSVVETVAAANVAVRHYIAENLSELLKDSNFENAVFSQSRGDRGREDLIFERLEALASAKPAIGH